jgi:hypothetical protein
MKSHLFFSSIGPKALSFLYIPLAHTTKCSRHSNLVLPGSIGCSSKRAINSLERLVGELYGRLEGYSETPLPLLLDAEVGEDLVLMLEGGVGEPCEPLSRLFSYLLEAARLFLSSLSGNTVHQEHMKGFNSLARPGEATQSTCEPK